MDVSKLNVNGIQKDIYEVDKYPKKNSDNLIGSHGLFNHGSVIDISELNATENPHILTKYGNLSEALAALPDECKKGGLSIKFINSNTDEYIQYKLISDLFNTNEKNWSVCDIGTYINSPEYIRVYTDKDNKILWAIQSNGNIYYGASIPQQVKTYIDSCIGDIMNGDAELTEIDSLNKIIAFLDGVSTSVSLNEILQEKYNSLSEIIQENSDSLLENLQGKVDKIEGQSLIDSDYASSKSTKNIPEYMEVTIDDEKRILESINHSGVKEIHVPTIIHNIQSMNVGDSEIYQIDSPEWSLLYLDENEHILFGVNENGETTDSKNIKDINVLCETIEEEITELQNRIFKKKKIKFLSIGNSYSQDALSYVPFILQNMGIDVDIQIGIAMMSSSSLSNHVNNFENESNVYTYYLYDGGEAWQKYTSKTLQYILSNKTWDIVCLQQSSGGVFNWNTYQPYLNKLVNYISDYVNNPIKFCWYAVQARPASSNGSVSTGDNWSDVEITTHYNNISINAEKVINETVCEFLIPVNTAIQNARSMAFLKAMGAYSEHPNNSSKCGYLTAYDGVHLQEGLPCQIAAYTFVLKLLDIYGFDEYSINGESTRVTSEWAENKAIPGPHGEYIGSIDENCFIAQKCAIMAVKNPYELTPMNYIINPSLDKGTYNIVSDFELSVNATKEQVINSLSNKIDSVSDGNYCTVQIPSSDNIPTDIIQTDGYEFNGTDWVYVYSKHLRHNPSQESLKIAMNDFIQVNELNGEFDVSEYDNINYNHE